jgi:hypothetical protein
MCGKDPWMREVFYTQLKRPAISRIGVAKQTREDGTAQRYADMFACLFTFAFEVVSMRHT